jgi:hypothetical protein
MVVIHGLAQITKDSVPQSALPDNLIGIRGYENRRYHITCFTQVSVEFRPSHSGHVDISD